MKFSDWICFDKQIVRTNKNADETAMMRRTNQTAMMRRLQSDCNDAQD